VPKYTIKLNPKDIGRVIKDIEKYKRELTEKVNLLIEELTDYGVQVAKAQVRELGAWYTGELESSIEGYFSPSVGVGIIKAGAPYAVYVEFGTGIVGKNQPHPSPDNWRYDINNHGDSGWWYFNDNTGRMQWTKGMPSRPFMYNTARELENACERIAREVFGR
jgi:HK97 gp10 family phage protein